MSKPERKRPGAATVRPQLEVKREGIFTGTTQELAAPVQTRQVTTPPVEKVTTKKPVTFSADVDLIDRARAAVLMSQAHPSGYRSLASLISAAIEEKLAGMADEFNNGDPIEPLSGAFRSGRPFQS